MVEGVRPPDRRPGPTNGRGVTLMTFLPLCGCRFWGLGFRVQVLSFRGLGFRG